MLSQPEFMKEMNFLNALDVKRNIYLSNVLSCQKNIRIFIKYFMIYETSFGENVYMRGGWHTSILSEYHDFRIVIGVMLFIHGHFLLTYLFLLLFSRWLLIIMSKEKQPMFAIYSHQHLTCNS